LSNSRINGTKPTQWSQQEDDSSDEELSDSESDSSSSNDDEDDPAAQFVLSQSQVKKSSKKSIAYSDSNSDESDSGSEDEDEDDIARHRNDTFAAIAKFEAKSSQGSSKSANDKFVSQSPSQSRKAGKEFKGKRKDDKYLNGYQFSQPV